jgi:carboxyl-terminal processing protease
MNQRWRIVLICTVSVSLLAFTGVQSGKYFEISKNIEIFTNVYKELNTWYVDDLDPATVMRTRIDAMVASMDPFTNYFSESQIEGYRQSEGQYDGIGAHIKVIDGHPTIVEPYEDSPATQAGLKAGDQILQVNGESAEGRSAEDVQSVLRGVPGTTAQLKIQRPGQKTPLEITLTRGAVTVPNVPHSGMEAEHIGYVALTTFSPDAGRNVAKALRDLRTQDPDLKGIVLDLRGNGGGLLREAVEVSNVFIGKNELVVSTRGKVSERDQEYRTRQDPVDGEIPLVVLIDKNSASASEIVSGVMQDLDRGVLLGERSYGKGLVQNTREVGYNARLKMTTAKYYIPSGRCIQSVQYANGEPVIIPDDQRTPFKTRNGRTVLDGGGVKPDILMEEPEAPEILKALNKEDLVFKYVTRYCLGHETIPPVEEFKFTDFDDFRKFIRESNFTFNSSAEKDLTDLEKSVNNLALSRDIQQQISELKKKIKSETDMHVEKYKDEILAQIELDITGRYYFESGKTKQRLKNDKELQKAIEILNDKNAYQASLQ